METQEKKAPVRDAFLRTLAVLGLIAILLLGAWGIIQLAVAIPSFFGSLGSGVGSFFNRSNTATSTKEVLMVASPATLSSGQTLQLTWDHTNKNSGTQYAYSISYACQSGLSLKAPLPNGSYQAVPCNTAFNYVNATNRMNVVPTVTGESDMPVIFTVAASKLSNGALAASGSATTKLSPQKEATKPTTTVKKPTTTKPASTYYAAPKPVALYGYGDLKVTMLSNAQTANGITVKFQVENAGTNVVNSGWTFNAMLPINGSYTFTSQSQQALNPGDKIVYSMQFSNPTTAGYGYQTGTVTVVADPTNWVPETNEANNTAQTTVQMYGSTPAYPYNPGYNYNQPTSIPASGYMYNY